MNQKEWWKSTTIWFNIILLVVAFIGELGNIIPLPAEFLAVTASIGNLLLRIKTVTGLKL